MILGNVPISSTIPALQAVQEHGSAVQQMWEQLIAGSALPSSNQDVSPSIHSRALVSLLVTLPWDLLWFEQSHICSFCAGVFQLLLARMAGADLEFPPSVSPSGHPFPWRRLWSLMDLPWWDGMMGHRPVLDFLLHC